MDLLLGNNSLQRMVMRNPIVHNIEFLMAQNSINVINGQVKMYTKSVQLRNKGNIMQKKVPQVHWTPPIGDWAVLNG